MYYFDNAATTYPKPESVLAEMMKCMENYCANPGRSGHKMALESARKIYEAREAVAQIVGAEDPFRIVFTCNATMAINIALKGLLKSGDHVITTSMEHNSVARPLHKLHKNGVINLTVVEATEEGRIDVKQIENAITEATKLIVTTHASNVTGTILPVEEISKMAKQHGVLYMLDASQTAGILPLKVHEWGVSMLAAPGHKGLLGPQGTGILYVAPEVNLDSLYEGGTGSKSEELDQPEIMPDKLESGTTNTPGFIGLLAGINYINSIGLDKIREHELKLRNHFIRGIMHLDKIQVYGVKNDDAVGVVSLNIAGYDSSEVTYLLDSQYKICTRSGLHCAPLAHKTIGTLACGTVRFSFGSFTTLEEVDYAIESVRHIATGV